MFTFFTRFSLFIFRQRGREGEREGEKHQCVVVSCTPPTGNLTRHATQAHALTGNRTSDPLVLRPALNPLSHATQGPCLLLYFSFQSVICMSANFPFHLSKIKHFCRWSHQAQQGIVIMVQEHNGNQCLTEYILSLKAALTK